MQSDLACPGPDELRRYAASGLESGRSAPMEAHLRRCSVCAAAVRELQSGGRAADPETGALRANESTSRSVRCEDAGRSSPADYDLADAPWEDETPPPVAALDARRADGVRQGAISPSAPSVPCVGESSERQHVGNYRLIARIGRGGMGTVYRAMHVKLEKPVAVKLLPAERMAHDDAVRRFHREMKAAGRLDHPNIVRATDAGEDQGVHYLVMDLVEGIDLGRLVRSRGPLPVAAACEIVRQAAEGLDYAHRQGLVHRDVKPSNLMLTHDGHVKVLDLGLALLAHAAEGDLTELNQALGTLDYMAPEQANDSHRVDRRADVYGLGCTLYWLLCGKPPFSDSRYRTLAQKVAAHLQAPPPPIRGQRPDVPDELACLLERMLAKGPDTRPQTAAEVARSVAPLAAGADLAELLPPPAPPASSPGIEPQPEAAQGGPSSLASTAGPPGSDVDRRRGEGPQMRPKRARRLFVGSVVALGALAILLGVVFKMRTPAGVLVVEVNQPGAEISIDDGEVVYTAPDGGAPVRIKVDEGNHTLRISKEGFEIFAREFTIASGGQQQIRAELQPLAKVALGDLALVSDLGAEVDEAGPAEPSPGDDALPGIVPSPPTLPGGLRWQIETVAPRGAVWSVAWSPDGKRVACGTIAGVRIYEAGSLKLLRVHPGRAGAIAWSPDSRRLASTRGSAVQIWREDGSPGPILRGHKSAVHGVAWRPDGQQLASAGADCIVRLWQSDGTPGAILQGHTSQVRAVAWNLDGKQLASAGDDRTVRLWRADGTPGPVLRHTGKLWTVVWRPDGQQLASAGMEGSVRLWQADGTPQAVLQGSGHRADWSPDGQWLAAIGSVPVLLLWRRGEHLPQAIAGRRAMAWSSVFSWSPDSRSLALGDTGGRLEVWNVEGTAGPARPSGRIGSVDWHPDGRQLATGGERCPVLLWGDDGAPMQVIGTRSGLVAWSADGRHLASADRGDAVRLWDRRGRAGPVVPGNVGALYSLAWHPEGTRLASATEDGTIRLWHRDRGAWAVIRGAGSIVFDAAWSPDGQRLASVGAGGVRLWQSDGTLASTLKSEAGGRRARVGMNNSVHWSPDGRWLAAGLGEVVQLWRSDGSLGPELHGHTDTIRCVRWSRDGRWLASTSQDGAIRLWHSDGRPGRVLRNPEPVGQAAWCPDGRRIASVSDDATLRVWDAETGRPLWVALYVPGENSPSVTFTPTGEILHGDPQVIEKELVYLVEKPDKSIELLAPSEFRKRFPPAGQKTKAR